MVQNVYIKHVTQMGPFPLDRASLWPYTDIFFIHLIHYMSTENE